MKTLRHIREKRGLSQRQLAAMSGISFRCMQQLEAPDHNWRISSLHSISHALNLPADGLDYFIAHYLRITPDSIEDISLRIHHDGFNSWKIHLFNFVDRFRHSQDMNLITRPPISELDIQLQALLASTVETLCHERLCRTQTWCRAIPPLDKPWFVSGMENLKAMALIESPTFYRVRNIFVLNNFLSRA